MKTMIKLAAYGAFAAGVIAIVRAARRSPQVQEEQILTEDDLFVDPVVITEEVIIVTESDPDYPGRFTL